MQNLSSPYIALPISEKLVKNIVKNKEKNIGKIYSPPGRHAWLTKVDVWQLFGCIAMRAIRREIREIRT